MASLIGSYSLSFGLLFSVFIIFFSVRNLRDAEILDKKIISFTFIQFFFVVISFFGLIISFINSDFSNETVFNHSHTTKPLFYKISGTWGNHEGSLLLWLLVLTLFISIFLLKSNQQPKKYRIFTLLFQQIIIVGFFIFLIKTSSPFNYIFPTPNEGLGLNPILQDPALAIHPPILYLGYVGSSIIFSSALAAMVTSYVSKEWAKHIKQWVLASWVFLTLGILLGSIWAYYELGWGGFWFWDPVENVSLMPWFALTTLLHCILVLEKKKILTSWAMILSIATFALSMSGTFLVRSGILNSVHTFAIIREGKSFIPKKTDEVRENDKIYVIINSSQMAETLEAFGHSEKISKKILIIGGGNIGYNLAKNIEDTLEGVRVKIVEKDKLRSEFLANELNNTIVINGNGLDEEVLSEANLDEAETVLALTNDDEDNLMVSVLVEKFAKDQKDIEDKRTMALINKPNYSLLQSSLKIDDLIDPRMNTVSSILKHIHKGTIENAYTISNGEYEVIEAEIIESSELINKELKNSNLPEEIRIGAVLRNKKVIIPKSDFIFQKDDQVVLIVKKETVGVVEDLFRLSSV